MGKIKQKFEDGFNYQNFLDFWSKEQIQAARKNFNSFYEQTKDTTKTFIQKDFKHHTKNFQEFLMVQKAVFNGASKHLPYSTLALLGEKLTHPAYKQDIQKIIQDNVVKFKGSYYKLDDYEHQKKIRKALKSYQFEECQEINNQAA
jgi:hypothetical protein